MPSPGEDIQSWSTTALNNGNADPLIVWSEGQARASVNNSSRSEMAAHAKDRNLQNGSIVTTGTPNAQAFLSGVSYTTIPTNLRAKLKVGPGLTNTGPMTLNMDGIGAVEVKTADGIGLGGNEFIAGSYVDLLYNGTNWIFLYSAEYFKDLITSGGGIILGQQIFSTAGSFVYTPTLGMEVCVIECLGGGGGGGGIQGFASAVYAAGGGGSGGYSRALKTAAQIGASQPITVGAAGAAGAIDLAGGAGGDTFVGASLAAALCAAKGGPGGGSRAEQFVGGLGASIVGAVGDIVAGGAPGGPGGGHFIGVQAQGPEGGSSQFGGGGGTSYNGVGKNATNYGSGGGGAAVQGTTSGYIGGTGSVGIIVITEFAGRGVPGATGATGPMGPAGPAGAGTGDVLVSGTPIVGQFAKWTDASHIQGVSIDLPMSPPQGRLTLQTATPVMLTTQAAKTTIFYTPHTGGAMIPLYNGAVWTMTTFSEISTTTTDTTKNPSAIGATKVNDWFIWLDTGSTLRICHGPDWTNTTTRSAGTALVQVNGVWLNNVAITNGPAAQRGTYVGTTYSNASSQLDWIFGASSAGGTAGFLGVWNAYNRVDVTTRVGDSTSSWNYSSATIRPSNNSLNNRVSFVSGLQEDAFLANFNMIISAAGANSQIGIGYDSTTAFHTSQTNGFVNGNVTMNACSTLQLTTLGFHFVQMLEAVAGGTPTFNGDGAGAIPLLGGLYFRMRM